MSPRRPFVALSILSALALAGSACHYKGLGEYCSQIDNCADGLSCVNARCAYATSTPTLPRCEALCSACSFNGWGALAFSGSGVVKCGYSFDYGSEGAAKAAALSACGRSDCSIVSGPSGDAGFRNQCAALAIRQPYSGRTWTTGRQSIDLATAAALGNCLLN